MYIYTTGIIHPSQAFFMYTNTDYNILGAFPLLFAPLANSPLSPFVPLFYLVGTLLAVTGSVHLGLRLLLN